MEAKDNFTLTWCDKHKNWWVTNCPDCMVDSNEEDIKKAGRREVIRYLVSDDNGLRIEMRGHKWGKQLKEWGI